MFNAWIGLLDHGLGDLSLGILSQTGAALEHTAGAQCDVRTGVPSGTLTVPE
jgi:hypothetical protein